MSPQSVRPDSIYRELSAIPTFKAAQFQGRDAVRVTTSAQDHVRKVHRTTFKTYTVHGEHVSVSASPDGSEVVASMVSPSGKHLAVLRETAEAATPDKKRYVEVWASDTLLAVENVTDKHGMFYTDEFLSSISFSPSETKLVYVAEQKEDDSDNENDPLAKYRFVPDLGETYGGRKKPVIFLYDWSLEAGKAVIPLARTDESQDVLLGHPVFAGEDKIVALGYESSADGRILGIIYCPNRPAGVWVLALPSELSVSGKEPLKCTSSKLTGPGLASRSPRVFQQDGRTRVVFASNPAGGPHHTCSRLQILDLETSKLTTLLDTVDDPEPGAFPGLYTASLPTYPFLQPSGFERFLIVSSVWRSRTTVLLVSISSGKVVDLTPDTAEHWSWTVLVADGGSQVVCVRSALNRPPELVLGTVDPNSGVSWRVLAKPALSDALRQKLADLTVSILPVPGHFPTETIVVQATTPGSRPCLTIPHGGPHSAATTAFGAWSTSFAIEGYTLAMPNYTGSIGFGEKYVMELLGKAGKLDVDDCIASVRYLIQQGISEPTEQYITGGSHGGFLIGHLLGQYPDVFRAATLRNPVTTLAEPGATDIPDWYFEELGVRWAPGTVMTPELYATAFARSPLAYVDAVRTPLQVHIGLRDRRVAPDQGKAYFHALRARGKDAEMLCFKEDMHGMETVEGSRGQWLATKLLFERVRGQ